tara:strand:+ start:1499 stop:2482 length:984 start_codon:yes stop_codon:yes gene_type:complete
MSSNPFASYTNMPDGHVVYDLASLMVDRLNQPQPLRVEHNLVALGKNTIRQLDDSRNGPRLRLSASGACIRQLAYSWHMYRPTNGVNATSRMTFAMGDMTENMMVAVLEEVFAELGDCDLLYTGDEQSDVHLSIPLGGNREFEVGGHPDGLMVLPRWQNEQEEKFRAILEVKSMSDYGFKKFRQNGLSEDDTYYAQVQAYMLARTRMDLQDCNYAYVVAYGKTTGAYDVDIIDADTNHWRPVAPIHGQWIKADPDYQEMLIGKFRSVIDSAGPEDFPRPFGPGKKGKLGFPCSYCSYMGECFPNSTMRADKTFWRAYASKINPYIED